jgi:putative ABC transport system substrate-binding protein
VIFAKGASVPSVAKATATIPIVFAVLSDVNAQIYVPNFARPTGNITGFSSNESTLAGKRFELLREISPRLVRVLFIRGRRPQTHLQLLRVSEDAARAGVAVIDGASDNETDIERTVTSFAQDPNGGVITAFDAFNIVHRGKIVELIAHYRLPAIYHFRLFVKSGGLLSYGFN